MRATRAKCEKNSSRTLASADARGLPQVRTFVSGPDRSVLCCTHQYMVQPSINTLVLAASVRLTPKRRM